jgi:oligopeptide/dipeptide ABC transporter ATP-binding protein
MTSNATSPHIKVRNLRKTYQVRSGMFGRPRPLQAVADVSFDVDAGTTFGLVGESGSGKTTIAKMLMLAIEPTTGSIEIGGRDLTQLTKNDRMKAYFELQPVLQDPYSSLNPRMRVGDIIGEPIRIHKTLNKAGREARVRELLELVGLPAEGAQRYPHEFSGGQRQRISIARALGLNPKCLILDEPVSALDVSIQAQILNLLKDLQERINLTYLLISHDLAVVANMSKRIGVLYLGQLMELADTEDIVSNPLHPYTQALISAVDDRSGTERGEVAISGEIPSPMNPPSGCVFHTRCPRAVAVCKTNKPLLEQWVPGRWSACHFSNEFLSSPEEKSLSSGSIIPIKRTATLATTTEVKNEL